MKSPLPAPPPAPDLPPSGRPWLSWALAGAMFAAFFGREWLSMTGYWRWIGLAALVVFVAATCWTRFRPESWTRRRSARP